MHAEDSIFVEDLERNICVAQELIRVFKIRFIVIYLRRFG